MTLKNSTTFNHSILGEAFEHNFDGRGGGGEGGNLNKPNFKSWYAGWGVGGCWSFRLIDA